jgi:hypothetical protein
MPIYTDFSLVKLEDGVLQIQLVPSVNISTWDLHFQLKRFPSSESGFASRWAGSGTAGGASGITFVNSGTGIFNVDLRSIDTSGLDPLNYYHTTDRLSSGSRTRLAQGFLNLRP